MDRLGSDDVSRQAIMLNSSSPSPRSTGIANGSPAISPHMPTGQPRQWPASMTPLDQAQDRGV